MIKSSITTYNYRVDGVFRWFRFLTHFPNPGGRSWGGVEHKWGHIFCAFQTPSTIIHKSWFQRTRICAFDGVYRLSLAHESLCFYMHVLNIWRVLFFGELLYAICHYKFVNYGYIPELDGGKVYRKQSDHIGQNHGVCLRLGWVKTYYYQIWGSRHPFASFFSRYHFRVRGFWRK